MGIHLRVLNESSVLSNMPWFQSFLRFFALYCIGQISQSQHNVGYHGCLVPGSFLTCLDIFETEQR